MENCVFKGSKVHTPPMQSSVTHLYLIFIFQFNSSSSASDRGKVRKGVMASCDCKFK